MHVLVAGAEGVAVAEDDLVLTGVALALGGLHVQARAGHAVADGAQQRLHPRGPDHGVVDVVLVGGLQVRVARGPRLLEGVAEDDELQLGPGVRRQPELGQPVELTSQHLARRGDDGGVVLPEHVAQHHRRALLPRQQAQRGQVGPQDEVAVAGRPRRHRVAVDRVHLDVDGEQVVARLGVVGQHLVQEVLGAAPLALQASLHVGHGHDHGVDRAVVDQRAQLLQGEQTGTPALVGAGHRRSFPASATAANSSSGALETRWWRL